MAAGMVPPAQRERYVPSPEVLRCAARRLMNSKAQQEMDDKESYGNSKKKIFLMDLDKVNRIWRAVALVIDHALLSNARGVRIESLGTFTLDVKGRAKFFLASEFAARHRLLKYDVCTGGSMAGGSVNTKLNIAKVAATAGSPRPEAERVLDAVLRSLRQCLGEGRSVSLSFHPVAEFSCIPCGQAGMRYLPAFRARQKAAAAAATRARIGVARANSKPTPWAAPVSSLADNDGTHRPNFAREDNSGVEIKAANPRKTGPASPTGTGKREKGGERPRSASGVTLREHRFVRERPATSYGGVGEAPTNDFQVLNEGNLAAPVVNAAVKRSPELERTPTAHHPNSPRDTMPAPSCASPCAPSSRNPRDSYGGEDGRDNDRAIVSTRVDGSDELHLYRGSDSGGLGISSQWEEEWLGDLLRRQTSAQAGEEGLRRLVGTITLLCIGDQGSDGRLSSRDLLQALRDVGTKLTSVELAEVASVFRRQPDNRISPRILLASMKCDRRPEPSVDVAAPNSSAAYISDSGNAGCQTGGSPCRSRSSRGSKGTATLHQRTSPRLSSGRGGKGSANGQHASASCYNGSTANTGAVKLASNRREGRRWQDPRVAEERCDVYDGPKVTRTRHGGFDSSTPRGDATAERADVSGAAAPSMSNTRRQCWGDREDGDRVGVEAAGDKIADLAGIIYTPPCSLEGLIHVLQASKVTEQPTIACASLARRLTQLRPALGKARAKELAAAACREPDKKVYLEQLHALLERRFGRGGSLSASMASRKNMSATPTPSAAVEVSCAAIGRVRRNLLAGKGGLGGLRTVFSKASGFDEGKLTKDELRHALTVAGGPGSLPPTAKDVEDLFTLFASQTSAGVGGGRVDSATVLRGLGGELNQSRERVVREVFRGILRLSSSNRFAIRDSVHGEDDRGWDGSGQGGTGTKYGMDGAVHEEELKKAYRSGGGSKALRVKGSTTSCNSNGRDAGLGGWCTDGPGLGSDTPRALLACANEEIRGRRAARNGVTVEHFLEYYRDVSAGIDGDDVFEATVRSSWPLAHSMRANNTPTVEEQGRQAAAKAGSGGCKSNSAPFAEGRKTLATSRIARAAPHTYENSADSNRTNTRKMGHTAMAVASALINSDVQATNGPTTATSVAGGYGQTPTASGWTLSSKKLTRQGASAVGSTSGKVSTARNSNMAGGEEGGKRERANVDLVEVAKLESKGHTVIEDGGRTWQSAPHTHRRRTGKADEKGGSGGPGQDQEEPTRQPQQQRWKKGALDERHSRTASFDHPQRLEAGDVSLSMIALNDGTVSCQKEDQKHVEPTPARPLSTGYAAHSSPHRGRKEQSRTMRDGTVSIAIVAKNDAPGRGRGEGTPIGRSAAAVRVQRIIRGHRGRRIAAAEERKRARQRALASEEKAERERPRAASHRLANRLPRPKVPGTYGF